MLLPTPASGAAIAVVDQKHLPEETAATMSTARSSVSERTSTSPFDSLMAPSVMHDRILFLLTNFIVISFKMVLGLSRRV